MSCASSVMPAQQTVSWYLSLCCGNALTKMRTRVRTCFEGVMWLHSHVLWLQAGDLAKCRGHAPAVARVMIALVTQQRDAAAELGGELLEQLLLCTEITIEIDEEALVAAGLAQSMPDGAWRTELRLMAICNTYAGKVDA